MTGSGSVAGGSGVGAGAGIGSGIGMASVGPPPSMPELPPPQLDSRQQSTTALNLKTKVRHGIGVHLLFVVRIIACSGKRVYDSSLSDECTGAWMAQRWRER
ncbi:MAG: hypothetical protein AAF680_00520 [Pseudomonadota bacterium]